MSDGRPTPRAHDGMGLFAVSDDIVRLVRNHEDQDPPGAAVPLVSPERAYDPLAGGGTTTLEVRIEADGRPVLVRDFVSLGGTLINCAGGPTPWRSWLTCEGNDLRTGARLDRAARVRVRGARRCGRTRPGRADKGYGTVHA